VQFKRGEGGESHILYLIVWIESAGYWCTHLVKSWISEREDEVTMKSEILDDIHESKRRRVLAVLNNSFIKEVGLSAEDIWNLLMHTGEHRYDIRESEGSYGDDFLDDMVEDGLLRKEDGNYINIPG